VSYKNLQIWQYSRDLTIDIHKMSLTLPQFEQMEEGRQIRRSSKSIRTNIVEGYGRRKYKMEFIKFIVYAIGSCEETIDHLEILYETGSLTNTETYESLVLRYTSLNKKLIRFLQTLEKSHNTYTHNSA
jgi:four helix bundle protein